MMRPLAFATLLLLAGCGEPEQGAELATDTGEIGSTDTGGDGVTDSRGTPSTADPGSGGTDVLADVAADVALVAINGSATEQSVVRDLPGGATGWREVLGFGAAIAEEEAGARITVPARSCGVFTP